jgi:hypothetical protein
MAAHPYFPCPRACSICTEAREAFKAREGNKNAALTYVQAHAQ